MAEFRLSFRLGGANKAAEQAELTQVAETARRGNAEALADVIRRGATANVRRRAMEALFEQKKAEAYELLSDLAAGPDMGLNDEILRNLRDTSGEISMAALARVLSCENTIRRALVVSLLAAPPEPAALTMLLRGARDPSRAVSRIGEQALVNRVSADPTQLAMLPRESISGIVSFLPIEVAQELVGPQFPSPVRQEAARRLGRVGGGDAV